MYIQAIRQQQHEMKWNIPTNFIVFFAEIKCFISRVLCTWLLQINIHCSSKTFQTPAKYVGFWKTSINDVQANGWMDGYAKLRTRHIVSSLHHLPFGTTFFYQRKFNLLYFFAYRLFSLSPSIWSWDLGCWMEGHTWSRSSKYASGQ